MANLYIDFTSVKLFQQKPPTAYILMGLLLNSFIPPQGLALYQYYSLITAALQ